MASAFDLIAEINLESRAFQSSLRNVASKLDATDKSLDGVISKSNKLGDTSATVARRLDKLNEGITAQRNRLLDNAVAFQKGEITAQKFSSVVTSVDKNVASLNSRLKDAKARLQELDETKLTHFQQQIQGAVNPQTTDVFKRLSSYQKGQLAMQGGDIFTQLASGTSPFQVLVQQGPQIAQIFAMGRSGTEGMATAEAAFAASAQTSAIAQAEVATSSAATAVSMEGAAASSTILGASVVSLGAILAAGLVTILAVWKATKDIEESAQARLKYEQLVTGEFNKQNILVAELAKKRAEAANERAFNQFASTAPPELIQQSRDQLLAQYNTALAKSNEIARRQSAVDSVVQADSQGKFFGQYRIPQSAIDTQTKLTAERATAQEEVQKYYDKIIALDAALEQSNQRRADKDVEFTRLAERTKFELQSEANKRAFEEQKKLEEHKKKLIDESIKKAKEFAEQVKRAGELATSIFASTSDNPFTKIFLDGENAVNKMLEATKGLGSELQNTLRSLIVNQTAVKSFAQSLTNALNASNLRNEAGMFASGEGADEAVKRRARMYQYANYSSSGARAADWQKNLKRAENELFQENIQRQMAAVGAVADVSRLSEAQVAELDRKIIAITQGVDPSKLTRSQQQSAANARLREADRLEADKEEDKAIRKQLVEVLKQLNGNKALQIDINDPANRTSIGGTSSNVTARYPAR